MNRRFEMAWAVLTMTVGIVVWILGVHFNLGLWAAFTAFAGTFTTLQGLDNFREARRWPS